jgi:tetratricopeptide (TPR) repeat protein/predicted Ser/Thr protein kinase
MHNLSAAMHDEQTDTLPADSDASWSSSDFEHRRSIASVRMKLFGKAPTMAIGRYRIERRIGAGGMGEVYLGVDESLGRKVAVKRVPPERSTSESPERLRNEARALARLSHQNVVQVYEVGEHEDQTFLAMEYVEGTTLTAWLSEPHAWQEILAVFLAAGRGLAAAHSAGVIHRDFKPDNVLISKDGRVCVADFGLAVAEDGESSRHEVSGTVRYMSLEQLRGEGIDARSDQFSYCIALYEALWKQEPFARATVADRVLALEDGRPKQPPRGLAPAAIWRVVRRGLQKQPDQRWPSFEALLEALEIIPARRRRRALLALALPVSLGVSWWFAVGSQTEACTGVGDELAGVWDADTKAEIAGAFESTEVAHAAATLERVEQGLDAWADAWTTERLAQCEAAHDKTDDESMARARRACLASQLRRVEVITEELGRADVEVMDRAVDVVARLPAPSHCSAAEQLEGPEPPPRELIDRVEELRLELAAARSLRELGRPDLEAVSGLVERARALDYPPLLAEAIAEQGDAEIAGGSARRGLELLDEAGRLALAAEHPRLLAETWTTLALHRATDYPEPLLAGQQLELADAAWSRVHADPRSRSQIAFGRGRVAQQRGELERAREHYREALSLVGEDDPERHAYLGSLAEVVETPQRIELREAALQTSERVFGPEHPNTALLAYQLGAEALERGDFERAASLLERAATIWMQAHREPHPNLARAHLLLASVAMQAGELDRAEHHARTMAAIQAQSLPSEHPDLGDPEMLLGRIAGLRDDSSEALDHLRAALGHYERGTDPAAPHVLQMRLDIAGYEIGLGELGRARTEIESVLALVSTGPHAALARLGLAEIALRERQFARAREHMLEVEAIGLAELADHQISHAILDALLDLRSGCEPCTSGDAERIAALMHEWGWTSDAVAPWLAELDVTRAEAQALGLPLATSDRK